MCIRDSNNCVFACDIDKECKKIYKLNFNMDIYGDLTKVEIDKIPNFDILCAGFPCQSFSNAGKKSIIGY
jgi:DNA (cytosine-5)-methyltransferase 1